MLSLFKSKQTPAAPASAPAAGVFKPIRLLKPSRASVNLLRRQVVSGTPNVDFTLPLTTAPHTTWQEMFCGTWRSFYPTIPVPLFTHHGLTISTQPFRLRSRVLMATIVADRTNDLAGPVIQEEADAALGQKRRRALDVFDHAPYPLPDIGKYVEGTIPRAEFDAARERLARHEKGLRRKQLEDRLAQEEADTVLAHLDSLSLE